MDPVAWFLGGGTRHDAVHARRVVQGVMGSPAALWTAVEAPVEHGGGHGVVGHDDLEVTAGVGLQTVVAPGQVFVLGSSALLQGSYLATVDEEVTVTHAVADVTHPRLDLVAVRIRDSDVDAGGIYRAEIIVITGVPAAVPAAPAVPANSLVLARVAVAAGAVSVGAITDRRVWAAALGGLQPVRSLPSGGDTQRLVCKDGRLYTWNVTAGAWQIVGGDLPRVSLRRNGSQALADGSAWSTISFGASTVEVYDTDGFHGAAAQGITIPAGLGGDYQISAGVGMADTLLYNLFHMQIAVASNTVTNEMNAAADGDVNSVMRATGGMRTTGEGSFTGGDWLSVTRLVRLEPGAVVTVQATQRRTGGGSLNVTGWLTAHMVNHLPEL